jgi:peptidoglycan/LPS O-acetylase OafA/YrhL
MLSTKIFDKLGLAFTFSELSSLGIPKREMARIGEVRWGLAWTNFGFTAIAFGVAPLILAMIRLRDFWPSKLFSITPLRYLGRLSYTIYIWHVPWFLFVAYLRDQMPKSSVPADLVALVLLIPGLFGVVVLAHRYVELPALRLKARFTPDPDAADIARKEAV